MTFKDFFHDLFYDFMLGCDYWKFSKLSLFHGIFFTYVT